MLPQACGIPAERSHFQYTRDPHALQTADALLQQSLDALTRLYERHAPPANGQPPVVGRGIPLEALQLQQQLGHSDPRFAAAANAPPTSWGTFEAGKRMTYNVTEHRDSMGQRYLLIGIAGLTSGSATGPNAASRMARSPGRTLDQAGEIAAYSMGKDDGEALAFGTTLGQWMAQVTHQSAEPPIFVVTGHSYGAAAAAQAYVTAAGQDTPTLCRLVNPAPLAVPDAPVDETMARELMCAWRLSKDPVERIQHAPLARHLLHRNERNWNLPVNFSLASQESGTRAHDHPARTVRHTLGVAPQTAASYQQFTCDGIEFIRRQLQSLQLGRGEVVRL